MAIASKVKIAVTPQSIFDELKDFVFYFDSDSIDDIAKGIKDILDNNQITKLDTTSQKQEDFRIENLYSTISKQLKKILLDDK
jgi:hypothetical protein